MYACMFSGWSLGTEQLLGVFFPVEDDFASPSFPRLPIVLCIVLRPPGQKQKLLKFNDMTSALNSLP